MHKIQKHIIKHHKKYIAWVLTYLFAHFFVIKVFLAKVVLIKVILVMIAIFGILIQHFSSADITPILRFTYTAFDLATKEDDGVIMPVLDTMINKSETHNLIQVNNVLPAYEGNDYVKGVTQKIITLSEMQVNMTLQGLLEKDVLNTEDLANLDNKISIKYVLGCDKTKGSYTIQQSINTNNHTTTTALENIILNVNICFDYSYIKNLPSYIQQITAHELGHYVYYFKDTHPQSFEQKCRKGNKMICQKKGFISKYAQTWPKEDYAESFAHRYLGDILQSKTDTSITTKINYFSTLF